MAKGLFSEDKVDIVIIDDNKKNVDLIAKYFKIKANLKTENHYDALYTLSLIKTRRPKLVIVNLSVSRFDPISTIKSMYASDEAKNIPVILISDGDKPEAIKQAMFYGAVDMIATPVSIVTLSRKVSKFLKFDISLVEKKKNRLEINVSNNIMIIEVEGFLFMESLMDYCEEINKALELFDKNAVKKALVIFYDVDIDSLTDENIDLLFDFFQTTPIENTDYVKILSSKDTITQKLKSNLNSKRFEFVSNYVEGISKLELAGINIELGMRLEFLKPNIKLVQDMYDINGKCIKKAYEFLTQEDINNFKLEGIERVFYESDLEKLKQIAERTDSLEQLKFDKALDSLDPQNTKQIGKDISGPFKFLRNKTILVIEDDVQMLEILSKFLAVKGFNVLTSMDSTKALDIVISKKPDLIITDIMMPNVDGHTFIESLNAKFQNRPPVIMITGSPTGENVKKAKLLGVNAFLAKPVDLKTLFVKIATELKKKHP